MCLCLCQRVFSLVCYKLVHPIWRLLIVAHSHGPTLQLQHTSQYIHTVQSWLTFNWIQPINIIHRMESVISSSSVHVYESRNMSRDPFRLLARFDAQTMDIHSCTCCCVGIKGFSWVAISYISVHLNGTFRYFQGLIIPISRMIGSVASVAFAFGNRSQKRSLNLAAMGLSVFSCKIVNCRQNISP